MPEDVFAPIQFRPAGPGRYKGPHGVGIHKMDDGTWAVFVPHPGRHYPDGRRPLSVWPTLVEAKGDAAGYVVEFADRIEADHERAAFLNTEYTRLRAVADRHLDELLGPGDDDWTAPFLIGSTVTVVGQPGMWTIDQIDMVRRDSRHVPGVPVDEPWAVLIRVDDDGTEHGAGSTLRLLRHADPAELRPNLRRTPIDPTWADLLRYTRQVHDYRTLHWRLAAELRERRAVGGLFARADCVQLLTSMTLARLAYTAACRLRDDAAHTLHSMEEAR